MSISRALWWAAGMLGLVGWLGCELDDYTNDICTDGEQRLCACVGGVIGIQSCGADGARWGACVCSPGGGAGGVTGGGGGAGGGTGGDGAAAGAGGQGASGGGTGGDAGSGGTAGGPPCGDGTCGVGEDCHGCETDCGSCDPCDEAPSCTDAMDPPATTTYMPSLDVGAMTSLGVDQARRRLEAYASRSDPTLLTLHRALSSPAPGGEPSAVVATREVLERYPTFASALRTELADALARAETSRVGGSDLGARPGEGLATRDIDYPGGNEACGAPLLRLEVSRITVHDKSEGTSNDRVYCVLQAQAASAAELRVTPITDPLDSGQYQDLSSEAGVFWGQLALVTPASDLVVTYDCVENDDASIYPELLAALADGGGDVGAVAGASQGWIFPAAAPVGSVVAAALATAGSTDDYLFSAQQTIGLGVQLELTNGYHWSVSQTEASWQWELTVRAWGCAPYGTL